MLFCIVVTPIDHEHSIVSFLPAFPSLSPLPSDLSRLSMCVPRIDIACLRCLWLCSTPRFNNKAVEEAEEVALPWRDSNRGEHASVLSVDLFYRKRLHIVQCEEA